MKKVTIYTDGSCLGNPGNGGFGAVLQYQGSEKCLSQGYINTTNNRMELLAVICALNALKHPCNVDLYTDSQYVKQGIEQWIINWKKNGWKTSNKKPVKNEDLWKKLDQAVINHTINWRWVKGHSGDPGNERADALARTAAESSNLIIDEGFGA